MRKRLRNPPPLFVEPAAAIALGYDSAVGPMASFTQLNIPHVESQLTCTCRAPAMSEVQSIWHYEVRNVQSSMTGQLYCQKGADIKRS